MLYKGVLHILYDGCVYSVLSLASGFLVLLSSVPYIASILRGSTKPNRVTWFVWASVGVLILFTYHELEGKAGFILTVAGALCQLIVALLSIKYGTGGTSVLDRVCFALVIVAYLIWWLTGFALYPYVLAVCIDLFAVTPTFSKTYHDPGSEDLAAWSICTIGVLLSVLAIEQWSFAEALFPVYALCVELTVVLLILRGKFRSLSHR